MRADMLHHDLDQLDDRAAEVAAEVFGLLSDPTRLALLWQLRDTERPVNELAELVSRPSPAVSQHLAKLRLAHLVATRREGTSVFYRLDNGHVRQLVVDGLSHAQHAVVSA